MKKYGDQEEAEEVIAELAKSAGGPPRLFSDPAILLDEATHVYTDRHSRRVPSVSQILPPPRFQASDWFLQRGTAVHECIRMMIDKTLDWSSVDERIAGRLHAAEKFLHDLQLEPLGVEVKLFSRQYYFAGRCDFYGKLPDGQYVVADWKGSLSPLALPQLAAYAMLLREYGQNVHTACAVETHDDGSFKLQWFSPRDLKYGERIFLGYLTTYNFEQANGLRKEEETK